MPHPEHDRKAAILFVDDEPNILRGLQRMLRHMRDELDIIYAGNGVEGLDILGSRPIDVIVSDLRMPGMSGSRLLAEVKNRYPHITRMALSGQAEQDQILQLAISAHQYLGKPCEADYLCAKLRRVCGFSKLVSTVPLLGRVCRITSLPSLPTNYDDVKQILENDKLSAQHVGLKIKNDLGMATKVLQLTNSPLFGGTTQISDPVEAAICLGKDTLRALVQTGQVFTELSDADIDKYSLNALWRRSALASDYAARIAVLEGLNDRDTQTVCLAAFLHDLSKLILIASAPDLYEDVLQLCRQKNKEYSKAVLTVIGLDEWDISGYLLALWALPTDVVEMVIHHRRPQPDSDSPDLRILQAIVHCAAAFSSNTSSDPTEFQQWNVDRDYIASMNLCEKVESWMRACIGLEKQDV